MRLRRGYRGGPALSAELGREGGGGRGAGGWPTWAGAINRDCGNRQRSKAEAQLGHGFYRSATFPQGLTAVVGAGEVGKASAGVACVSHTEPSADAGIVSARVEGWPGALRTTVTQNLICAPLPAEDKLGLYTCPHPAMVPSLMLPPAKLPRYDATIYA